MSFDSEFCSNSNELSITWLGLHPSAPTWFQWKTPLTGQNRRCEKPKNTITYLSKFSNNHTPARDVFVTSVPKIFQINLEQNKPHWRLRTKGLTRHVVFLILDKHINPNQTLVSWTIFNQETFTARGQVKQLPKSIYTNADIWFSTATIDTSIYGQQHR